MTGIIVPDLLRERAAADPADVAVRVGREGVLNLGEWELRSNAAARGLVERGVRPGDRIALRLDEHRWDDYAVAYLAVLKAGGVAVPLGSRFAGAEVDRILAHAEPVGLIGRPTGSPFRSGAWDLDLAEVEDGRGGDTFQVPTGPDALAEILYTSGTTGRPKGVACTHANVLGHDLPAEAASAPPGPLSFLHCFPIGTQAGQETLRVPLRIPMRTAVALTTFDAELLCTLVARHRVQRLQLVPAMAQVLLSSGAIGRHDVSSVRRVILSSAHAPPALFERLASAFPSASLWNAYALTEAGSARTMAEWDRARPSSVGRPVGETELRIVGDDGADLPPGRVGEVWLRRRGSPPRAYFRDPEATAEVFVDGWTRSGDLGHLDEEGHLHLDDRKKDLIISGGRNISSVEIEDALAEHPDVAEAAVFGVAHPVLGEDVGAAVVADRRVGARELQDFARRRLAEHKVPHLVVLVDRLPRNPSGKVLKGELRDRFGAGPSASAHVPPRSELEAVVARVWSEVLARPAVGADDDFFALGGHSLAAAQIAARLGDALGLPVAVGAVFEAPTVAELSQLLASTPPAGGDPSP